jgi:3-deoxy-D-manno-octulosonate 8-phosphate phosphatase (KDO 8-P phosphatase)
MNKIKLLILDVDGVLTDGKKYYGIDGIPVAKTFCDKDWTSIKRFKALGTEVIFLTGDQRINEEVGKNRNIPVYLSRGLDKLEFLNQFEKEYNCSKNNIAYIGDDLFDINIMKNVGFSFCTSDSPKIVKDQANTVLNNKGGDNVILELFEYCEKNSLIPTIEFNTIMEKINDLDKKEIF